MFTCFDESISIDELDRIGFGPALRGVVVPVVVPVVEDINLPDALNHLWRKSISYNCVIWRVSLSDAQKGKEV